MNKVLVVEDNAFDRRLLRHTLEHHGCTVIEARDGEEGLDLAIRHHPDTVSYTHLTLPTTPYV